MLKNFGSVYSMTNEADNNQVVAFTRNKDGYLTYFNTYNTGGSGTGAQTADPLMSQGSVIISPDQRLLFAVNAKSNSISCFAIEEDGGLFLLDTASSGGETPNSLAIFGDILYVANSGNANGQSASNITGFHIDCCGKFCRIPGASYLLSGPAARPACLVFSPKGDKLVVSELSVNRLTVFSVCHDGTLMHGTVSASSGAGPFGSAFLKNGLLLVSEAGAGALSSYLTFGHGQLAVISGSASNGQAATCWVSVSRNQQIAYTSNAGSDSISIYDININGTLSFRKNVSDNPNGTAAPLDNGVSGDGRNFYALNGNEGTISIFRITTDGDLVLQQILNDTGLPQIGAQGLAVL